MICRLAYLCASLAFAAALMLLALPACTQTRSGGAQWASSCPSGQKLAAGACVTSCPGGYEDRGSYCFMVSQSD